jgi:PTS system nitrogen regulatory IIA component
MSTGYLSLENILSLSRCKIASEATTRKSALELLGNLISTGLDIKTKDLVSQFLQRERLGSTCIGNGIAIPHIRSKAIDIPVAACMISKNPIKFDDTNYDVNFFFALVVPDQKNDQYMQVISTLAEMFNNESTCQKLRSSSSEQVLYNTLVTHYQNLVLHKEDHA